MTPAEVEAKLREKHAYEVAHYPPADKLHIAAADALAAQAVELERMRKALEPFALAGATLSSRWQDHETHWQGALSYEISAGQLRAARQALVKAG